MTEPVPALADFPLRLRMASWFSVVGAPLTQAERSDIEEYTSSLGLGTFEVVEIENWQDAEACIKNTDWDANWWQAEEDRRKLLLEQAEQKIGDTPLTHALTNLSDKVSDIVHGAAAIAASRGGVADQGLTRSAAGAATMSAYQAAVEMAAGDTVANDNSGHPFAAKFRLFEAGHWPLCVRSGAIHVF